ncbi:MAG: ATP-binding cassette domain-containing protein [Arhodomonas sp.]|nr:ATP-binding cassette domain-containing protein [Arhodomonas sp.]
MGEAVIDVRGLVTRIGGHTIHDGLDLRVDRGELLAIAGGSGSGKTVLIRAITRLLPAAAGEIRLFGVPMEGLDRQGNGPCADAWR